MSLAANEQLVSEVASHISSSLNSVINAQALSKNLIMVALKSSNLEGFIAAATPFGRFKATSMDKIFKRVHAERDALKKAEASRGVTDSTSPAISGNFAAGSTQSGSHRLEPSPATVGGLMIPRKRAQDVAGAADVVFTPGTSRLGLDELARAKRAERGIDTDFDAKRKKGTEGPISIHESLDVDVSTADETAHAPESHSTFKHPSHAHNQHVRTTRIARIDTPSEPGGVSSDALDSIHARQREARLRAEDSAMNKASSGRDSSRLPDSHRSADDNRDRHSSGDRDRHRDGDRDRDSAVVLQ
jgi:hypothetical protein